jgi:NADPH-dependent 2,4-dienoyl-CoA reductase/sulfur reductase-like enzyme
VVGAGPAGLAAAKAASFRTSVVLVDAEVQPGGQVWRSGPRRVSLPNRYRGLDQKEGLRILSGREVWLIRPSASGFSLFLDDGGRVEGRGLILCPGSTELVLPSPGWDRPGVLSGGAAQILAKSYGLLASGRWVVAGNGPFVLQVAAELSHRGAEILMVCLASTLESPEGLFAALARPSKLAQALGQLGSLWWKRVRLLERAGVIGVEGDGPFRVRIARLRSDWEPLSGEELWIEADGVALSFGFVPRLELALQLDLSCRRPRGHPSGAVAVDGRMRTSREGVWAAGEVVGLGGWEEAERHGRLAGSDAARWVTTKPGQRGPWFGGQAKRGAWAKSLEQLWAIRPGWTSWLDETCVVCRCEAVTWGEVLGALHGGARDLRGLRGLCRVGMGPCQGRICGPPLQMAVAKMLGVSPDVVGHLQARPVAVPVRLEKVI